MEILSKDFNSFLLWIKEVTEKNWSNIALYKTQKSASHYKDISFEGAKWCNPLTDYEIKEIEIKWNFKFSENYKLFLKTLHYVDKPEIINYNKDGYTITDDSDDKVIDSTSSYDVFFNWRNEKKIQERINWAYESILSDVLDSRLWLKSWGERPKYSKDRIKIFTEWFESAPSLIPVTSHRYLLSGVSDKYEPVISIWGSDIVVMGWNFKSYLLRELNNDLGIYFESFDEEDQCLYLNHIPKIEDYFKNDFEFKFDKEIKKWEEVILFWSSGWSSFGKNYFENSNGLQPILQTYNVDNTENTETRSLKMY